MARESSGASMASTGSGTSTPSRGRRRVGEGRDSVEPSRSERPRARARRAGAGCRSRCKDSPGRSARSVPTDLRAITGSLPRPGCSSRRRSERATVPGDAFDTRPSARAAPRYLKRAWAGRQRRRPSHARGFGRFAWRGEPRRRQRSRLRSGLRRLASSGLGCGDLGSCPRRGLLEALPQHSRSGVRDAVSGVVIVERSLPVASDSSEKADVPIGHEGLPEGRAPAARRPPRRAVRR